MTFGGSACALLGEGPEPVEVASLRLQEYQRFRHLVRNLYADELRPEPVVTLLRELPEVWELWSMT